jgi:cytochrome c556
VYVEFGDKCGRMRPSFPGDSEVNRAIGAALDPMWLNETDVKSACTKAAADANEVFAKLNE